MDLWTNILYVGWVTMLKRLSHHGVHQHLTTAALIFFSGCLYLLIIIS